MASMTQIAFLALGLAVCSRANCQIGAGGMRPPSTTSVSALDPTAIDLWMNDNQADRRRNQVENLSDSVSKLDIKAPGQARREYSKGMQSLSQKRFPEAVERLARAIEIYPDFVAAHNGLGSAYMDLGQTANAKKEYAQAVALDGHLPFSYMNLGRAELALRNYPAAQEAMQKASDLAPLDLHLLTALTYAQFLNQDYADAIATAQRVHGRQHESAAIVHYFAAASWQGQNNLQETRNELQIFLHEDPQSAMADAARKMVEQIETRKGEPGESVTITYSAAPDDGGASGLRVLRQLQQQREVAEAEASGDCETCAAPTEEAAPAGYTSQRLISGPKASLPPSALVMRSRVNEVAVFFAATDHGKSVSDLTREEIEIRDAGKPPAKVIAFRNEADLPLRMGLVIDTSSSITREFEFEKKAAASFLKKTVTDEKDLAFVVGFSSSVLLSQDWTGNDEAISKGVDQLAPAGGTSLWDAVQFAAEKLSNRVELQPVAKILVVISDGDDNASTASLKQAIESAARGEVMVYTVSTREFEGENSSSMVADRAMKLLASRTGGAAFFPDSLGNLDKRLADLQQVIRSRYLISYKPADLQTDSQYRSIAIVALRSGHKMRVYARRGYYAKSE
jgi:Ca-activated chloride channel family protein